MHDEDDVTSIKNLFKRKWEGVLLTNDLTVSYFNMQQRFGARLGYTFDIVRLHTPVFFFHKQSILTWLFDTKIQACNEAGLTYYWASKYKRKHLKNKTKQPKKLAINNILAMLQISFFMYAVSICTFLLELLSRRYK